MKPIFIFSILIILSCNSNKSDKLNVSDNQFTKAYSLTELKEGLTEITGDHNSSLMIPLKEYVYELGYEATGTFLFNNKGEKIHFEICLADYPSPISKKIHYLKKPMNIGGDSLVEFLEKLDDYNKDDVLSDHFDFILFYVWNMSKNRRHDIKTKKLHASLIEDLNNLNSDYPSIQLINLFTGNYEKYQIEPDSFLAQKVQYMNYLIESGKVKF